MRLADEARRSGGAVIAAIVLFSSTFALSLLTVKPQYGLIAPVLLAARGDWRAFAAAAAFSLILAGISFAAYGGAPWQAFIDSATTDALQAHAGRIHRDMRTTAQAVGMLDFDLGARNLAQGLVALGAATATFFAARRWRRDAAIGFALIASAAASPSLWVYDWPMFFAGLLLLARDDLRMQPHLPLLAGLLWIAPLYSLGFATMESSLAAPAILIAKLAAFFVHGRKTGRT